MSLQALHAYDFDNDADFQAGLSSILSQAPGDSVGSENGDIVAQAKCFYFSRKHNIDPPIDAGAYQTFTQRQTEMQHASDESSGNSVTTSAPAPAPLNSIENSIISPTAPTSASQPAYPPTFAELVDLITRNKPIPGIEEIPDTVIADESLLDYCAPPKTINTATNGAGLPTGRRKPWEKAPPTTATHTPDVKSDD